MKNRYRCPLGRTLTVLAFAAVPALAAPLPPGANLFPAPAEPVPDGGTLVAGGDSMPVVAPTFSGTLTTAVIAGDTANPFGGLTFTYLLTNDAGSAHVISQLAVPGFRGFLIDASYRESSPGTPPTSISRSSTGDAVSFHFLDAIGPGSLAPGSSSTLLVLQTDASNFCAMAASVINGSVGGGPSFAPGVAADFNHDCRVDSDDLEIFRACMTGPGVPYDPANLPPGCTLTPDASGRIAADFDGDGDVDMDDFGVFQRCFGGPDRQPDPACSG